MRVPLFAAVLLALAAGCGPKGEGGAKRVGFVQWTTTTSLDDAREGFVKGLAGAAEVDLQNANADASTLRLTLDKFRSDGVALVATAGTPAAQAAAKTVTDRPVIFSAVVDPVVIGVAESPTRGKGEVTGVANPFPVADGLRLLHRTMPGAKTVGSLYDPGEAFFPAMDEEARKTAGELGLTWVTVAVTAPTDVPSAVAALRAKGVDALLQLPSNTINPAVDGEAKAAGRAGMPFFSLQPDQVGKGVVAALGIDLYACGVEQGKIAARVLRGEKASAIAILPPPRSEIAFDPALVAKYGLRVSADDRKRAEADEAARRERR